MSTNSAKNIVKGKPIFLVTVPGISLSQSKCVMIHEASHRSVTSSKH